MSIFFSLKISKFQHQLIQSFLTLHLFVLIVILPHLPGEWGGGHTSKGQLRFSECKLQVHDRNEANQNACNWGEKTIPRRFNWHQKIVSLPQNKLDLVMTSFEFFLIEGQLLSFCMAIPSLCTYESSPFFKYKIICAPIPHSRRRMILLSFCGFPLISSAFSTTSVLLFRPFFSSPLTPSS